MSAGYKSQARRYNAFAGFNNSWGFPGKPPRRRRWSKNRQKALPEPPRDYEDAVSACIWQFHVRRRQTDATYERKLELRCALFYVVSDIFHSAELYIVGSSMNGFGADVSDLDLCLTINSQELEQRQGAPAIYNQLMRPLQLCHFIRDIQIVPANVPILKFHDALSGLDCDLTINTCVGVQNTHLLGAYARCDWRVRPLVMFVKQWAQQQDIHDASRGRLSSYSLVLLLIQFLQAGAQPPVLPSLQELFPDCFSGERPPAEVDMRLELPWKDLQSRNSQSLCQLFAGFVRFYAEDFDFSSSAVSVRLGRPLPIQVALKQLPAHEQLLAAKSFKVFIEEPYLLTNVARSVLEDGVLSRIVRVFSVTHALLKAQGDPEALVTCSA